MLSERDRRVSVTRQLSAWSWKNRDANRHRVHTNGTKSGMSIEMREMTAEQSKKY